MPPVPWLAVMFAAGLLLVGVVGCVLTGLVERRHFRPEQMNMEQRWNALTDQVLGLEKRVAELEAGERAVGATRVRGKSGFYTPRLASTRCVPGAKVDRRPHSRGVAWRSERDASGLRERHAAIQALAETGATPDVIARATGQPIGQIELVLGLLRQIDSTKTTFPHGPHA